MMEKAHVSDFLYEEHSISEHYDDTPHAPVHRAKQFSDEDLEHFSEENGQLFAGRHVLLDLWDARHLDNEPLIQEAFLKAVEKCKATLLGINTHVFEPNGGVTGVAILAESHISIHTWPEIGYAAVDIFMCGDAAPLNAVPVFREYFETDNVSVRDVKRGELK